MEEVITVNVFLAAFAAVNALGMMPAFDLLHELLFGCYMFQRVRGARWTYRRTYLISFATILIALMGGAGGMLIAGIVVGWFFRSLYQYKVEGKIVSRFLRYRLAIVETENGA